MNANSKEKQNKKKLETQNINELNFLYMQFRRNVIISHAYPQLTPCLQRHSALLILSKREKIKQTRKNSISHEFLFTEDQEKQRKQTREKFTISCRDFSATNT